MTPGFHSEGEEHPGPHYLTQPPLGRTYNLGDLLPHQVVLFLTVLQCDFLGSKHQGSNSYS